MWQAEVVTGVLWLLLGCMPSLAFTPSELLQRSYGEQRFETLLLLRHRRQLQCSQMEEVAAAATWPLLRLNSDANFYLQRSQSTEMLALICLTGSGQMDAEMWQALASNLSNMRHIRLLVLLQRATDQQLHEIASTARRQLFPHVVLLLLESGEAYQLQPYVDTDWLLLRSNSSPIFPKQYNYHQRTARTLPEELVPSALSYTDWRTGKTRLTGIMTMMLMEFARVHNISLQWEEQLQTVEHISMILLRNMTLNGTLDLPMTLCGYELSTVDGAFTYPYDISEWFIIVPCAQEIATAKVYLKVVSRNMLIVLLASYYIFALLDTCFAWLLMDRQVDWANLYFNERIISGLIGQASRLKAHATNSSRLAHAQLFLLGLVLSTLVAVHLKTLLTKRPMERMVTNFVELRDSQLDIHFTEDEHFYVNMMSKLSPLHTVRSKIVFLEAREFERMRKSLSKSKAFSMTEIIWEFYKQQQKLFKRPVLCYQPDLVFRSKILASMPLQPNSIYAEPLHQFMIQVKDTGLVMYWMEQSLRDFMALGEISLKDPYPYEPFHDFKVNDLIYVWLGWATALLLAFATFLCELLINRLTKK
ncbi:hypothetical protein AWZ03_000756 [Drosophila navojoa]|uniref:Ionotropic glutamate receptor C-terminal domain-containing protein n=1 Tax=Drosophila navojoa TaxID=7232 RepID=A0A484BV15_DRONA|nr:uncharacterized protein LOC108650193 [Drosophila navojoa]TDG52523.1 hypothetical protein AWZ03_000756 [Drosophila navojoa]